MDKRIIQIKLIIHNLLRLNWLLIIVGVLSSCGSGATGSDPLGLDSITVDASVKSLKAGESSVITATVKHANGTAATGRSVSFSFAANNSAGTLTVNDSGTSTGMAIATYTAGTGAPTSIVQDTVRASIENGANAALVITRVAGSEPPPNLSLSDLAITPPTISAGGSAGVSVTVKDSLGNPYTTPVLISFTSNGVQANKSTITQQAYTVNGVASATYRDINYASVDKITATLSIGGSTITEEGTITVNTASAGSISFVSATPANIALKGTGGTGRSETSIVVFKVLDANGIPITKKVNMVANTTVGSLSLTTASANSDPATGLVQTVVQAGTVSTPVRVTATIDGTTISTTSDQLVISTGIPSQNSFSLAPSTLNIEGWDQDGVTDIVSALLADHFNNPAPDGTAVYFRTSGGSIQPSCTTTGGACAVTFTSQNPRPANGRAVVLAYTLGEESFVDLNGNGIYDTGIPDTFTDMPEPFLDANENRIKDVTEEFVDTNGDGLYSPGDGIFNGILRDASISGPKTIHVRSFTTVVMSGSNAVIKINGSTSPTPLNIPACTTAAPFTPSIVQFSVIVTDENGNIMPAGTTISFSTTNGTIANTPTTYTVVNTATKTPPTYTVMIQSDASQSGTAAPYTCTNSKASGLFIVTVTTPKDVSSYQYMTLND